MIAQVHAAVRSCARPPCRAAVGVAVFAGSYLSLAHPAVPAQVSHAFAITTAAMAGGGLLATAAAHLATHIRS